MPRHFARAIVEGSESFNLSPRLRGVRVFGRKPINENYGTFKVCGGHPDVARSSRSRVSKVLGNFHGDSSVRGNSYMRPPTFRRQLMCSDEWSAAWNFPNHKLGSRPRCARCDRFHPNVTICFPKREPMVPPLRLFSYCRLLPPREITKFF
jgi:hypothetical protein